MKYFSQDLRTGPNRNHLGGHEGLEWRNAKLEDQCDYDLEGNLITPNCKVEKMCRDHKSFGTTTCVRDHYFELFDIEKNFGEKRFCGEDTVRFKGGWKDYKPWKHLQIAMGLQRSSDLRSPFNKVKVLSVISNFIILLIRNFFTTEEYRFKFLTRETNTPSN